MAGELTNCLLRLQDALGDSAAWRTWTGTTNATDAKARAHLYEAPESEASPLARPYCLIVDAHHMGEQIVDDRGFWGPGGAIEVIVEDEYDLDNNADPASAQFLAFNTNLEAVLADLKADAPRERFAIESVEIGEPAFELARTVYKDDTTRLVAIARMLTINWRRD